MKKEESEGEIETFDIGLPRLLAHCVPRIYHFLSWFGQGGANEHIAEARRFLGSNPAGPPI